MGFIHRYFVQAPVGIALPEPPPELRSARLCGPLGGGWLCLDSSRVHDLDLDFARRLSAAEGVGEVLAITEHTSANSAHCERFERGSALELEVSAAERLGFDPREELGPEIRIYPDRIQPFWLVAFGLSVAAPLLPRWVGWSATPFIGAGFLLGWFGGSLWLRHQRRLVAMGGGLLVALGLALLASFAALSFE